jgi:hypothetical protein
MTGTSGDPSFNLSPKMIGFYAQDDWRVTPRLLLNIGVRYDRDIDTYGLDKQRNSRTHQELIAAAASGVPTVPLTSNPVTFLNSYTPNLTNIGGDYTGLPHNDGLDISPRIGFAYDVFGNSRVVVRGGYGLYYGQSFENIPLFMIQQANNQVFANTFSISCNGPGSSCSAADNTVPGTDIVLNQYRYGIDPPPVIPPASYDLAAGSTGRIMSPHYRNPYTQQINFGLQIAPNTHSVVEVEYVQARGLHDNKTVNTNPTQYFLPGSPRPYSAAFAAANVPVLGRIAVEESIGRAYYDGLNLSYRQQMWKRITGTANYTYAKALAFEGGAASFRNTATNPFLGQFRRQDYGLSPNDETHHLTASATISLPWKIDISPIFQVGSGRPVDIVQSTGDLWGVGSGRGNPHAVIPAGAKKNPAAYESYAGIGGADYKSCLIAGTCQETSYDGYRSPPFVELDARIGKTITFGEKYNVNLFFQGFDLTNRANFGPSIQGNVSDFDTDPSKNTFLKPFDFITPGSTVLPKSFTGEFGARFSF